MSQGAAVLAGSLHFIKRIVGTDGEGERGRGEAGFPPAVPGADHDRDGEDNETTLGEIRKEQGRDESQEGAKESDSIAENGSACRSYGKGAGEREFHYCD